MKVRREACMWLILSFPQMAGARPDGSEEAAGSQY
jgi:hypothetical protein